ncbi:unnamed protein product [Rotaria socialis]|uniref:S-adenosyl-L-homocysteine hydrolase NAD binding domain-containing protein n=1 Tax=Rotaria socialis TaxID=392032 RepID=A0A820SY08_9BILA|nr:unnamed protein product [Rotaria socialis]CAF4463374.1 unnamed protein product [Rotaria socialis]
MNPNEIVTHIPFETRVHQQCIGLSDLTLLSSIVKEVENEKLLRNYTIWNIQHELGDMAAQIEALLALGALPSNLYFLPPPYTHHKGFEQYIVEHFRVPVENFFHGTPYCLSYNYEKYRLAQVLFELNRMMTIELTTKTAVEMKLLVSDSGGCFSEALAYLYEIDEGRLDPNQLFENVPVAFKMERSDISLLLSHLGSIEIRLVEKTSRGLIKYADQPNIKKALCRIGTSIVDVASSQPKRQIEPTLIGEACLNMLSYLFYDAPKTLRISKPLESHKCLLLGYGAIGQAIAHALIHDDGLNVFSKDSVKVWDRDPSRCQLAQQECFEIFDNWKSNEEFDYVIGCTGRCSLPISSFSLLRNNAYLISVSSGAVEFPVHEMVQCALSDTEISISSSNIDELASEDIHRNIEFRIGNRRKVTVVNGGMPITFLGLLNPTLPEKFDITVSCVIAASIQAVRLHPQTNEGNRIIPLDATYSTLICDWFKPRVE